MTTIHSLRLGFALMLAVMLTAVVWASWRSPLFAIPPEVRTHPWFLVTLLDAYLAFLVVALWVAWKEQGRWARCLWPIVLLLWGNVAIALYVLRELFRLNPQESITTLISSRAQRGLTLPITLLVTAVAAYGWGWRDA